MGFFQPFKPLKPKQVPVTRRLDPQALRDQQTTKLVYSEEELREAIGQAADDVFRSIRLAADFPVNSTINLNVAGLSVLGSPAVKLYAGPDLGTDPLFKIQADSVTLDGVRVEYVDRYADTFVKVDTGETYSFATIANCHVLTENYFLDGYSTDSEWLLRFSKIENNFIRDGGATDTIKLSALRSTVSGNIAGTPYNINLWDCRACSITGNVLGGGTITSDGGILVRDNIVDGNAYISGSSAVHASDTLGDNST